MEPTIRPKLTTCWSASDFSVAPSLFVPTEDLKQRNVNLLEKDSRTLVERPTRVADPKRRYLTVWR